jgi:hypothetical protein
MLGQPLRDMSQLANDTGNNKLKKNEKHHRKDNDCFYRKDSE